MQIFWNKKKHHLSSKSILASHMWKNHDFFLKVQEKRNKYESIKNGQFQNLGSTTRNNICRKISKA